MAVLAAGALFPYAFAPHDWLAAAPLSLMVLLYCWRTVGPGRAWWLGYAHGLAQFYVGVNWVSVSMHDYGNAPWWLAQLLTLLLSCYLALFPALAGWATARLCRPGAALRPLLAAPAAWVLAEWLRGGLLTGFPWLEIGYSQIDGPLAALAPLLGVYGVGWATVLLAGWLAALPGRCRRWRLASVPVVLALWAGLAGLSRLAWTEPASPPLQAALIQGSIPIERKWQEEFRPRTLQIYGAATRAHLDADLIVWPEEAVAYAWQAVSGDFIAELAAEARQSGAAILSGFIWLEDEGHYYNAMTAFGAGDGSYFKRHLVPFGEFIPLQPFFGFMADVLNMQIGEFQRGGDDQPPMRVLGHAVAGSICYEDAFGRDSRFALPEAAWIVNVTNDAWFGDTRAPHQHIQMTRMRALETGRYVLRAANTGATAIIGPQGEWVARAPLFQQTVLRGEFRAMRGATPYVRWGDWPVLIGSAICLGLAALLRRRAA